MLTVKHSVGQKVGQLQGRNPRAALGLAGVLRALPVGCCALSFHQISLFWGQNVCHKGHTRTYLPSALAGPKASLEQFPNELSKPLKHRGRVGSARGVAGAMPQVPVNPPDPPRRRPGAIPRTQLPAQHQHPHLGPLPALCNLPERLHQSTRGTWHPPWGCASTGCSPCSPGSADTHLLWLQGSDGQQSSKEILVETPGLAALERYRYSPPSLPCRDLLFLPFHRCRFSSGGSVEEVNGLSPFRP